MNSISSPRLKPFPTLLLALAVWLIFVLPALTQGPAATGPSPQIEPGQTPAGLTPAEWGNIQSQIAAGQSRAYPAEAGGYVSSNPAHGWQIAYDAVGRTRLTPRDPAAPAWEWSLRLTGYGYGQPAAIAGQPILHSDTGQLTYRWDANLSEWWRNSAAGLEQGFTLQQRPGRANGQPLVVEMAVGGNLTVTTQGQRLTFADSSGATILTYDKLRVTDAAGQVIPARFAATARRLQLVVEDAAAIYPLTIDPLVQQAYLKASNTGTVDYFGYAVAISGDTLVVGAYQESSNATGVNGDQTNNSAGGSGAAYVFVRDGTSWSQQAYLKASNTGGGDNFGYAVAISGDTLVVGAYQESSNATGVNGDQTNNSAGGSGAAYVFVRDGTSWSQQAYLKASNTENSDSFGKAVAISGDTVVVGATSEDSNATGVDGTQTDNTATSAGAAYVFVRNGTSWSQQAYLKASNTGDSDVFGRAVTISGDTVVVGADLEDSNATGVDGTQTDNNATDSGAAYVFVRSGVTWSQQAYLKASNTGGGDNFGYAVSISSDTLVVGAYNEDSNATGVDGNQTDNSFPGSGAAYVFVRSAEGTWSQQTYLKASNTGAFDYFGWAVSISDDIVVVGAYEEDSSATGVDGNQTDNNASAAGAAYVFTRGGTTWSQQAYLKASNAGGYDRFGHAVAISGDTVVVGAYLEDSSATGVDGNQADNTATNAGAAYVFFISPSLPDVTIAKTVTSVAAKPGDSITYTLTFSNAGGATATGVIITDSVPVSVTGVSVISGEATITQTGTAPNFVWQVANLGPNEGGVITLTGVLSNPLAAGVFTNTAEIIATGDIDPTNNQSGVGLTVQNIAPVAADDTASTNLNTAVIISPLLNDTDANHDPLSISALSLPAHGTAILSGTTQVVYTPTTSFSGYDSFTYAADDGTLTDTATITVTINAAPSANAGSDQTVAQTTTVQLDGSGSSDPDSDPLTYGWAQTGGSPTLTLSDRAAISPTFTAGSAGVFTFTLTVTDTLDQSDSDQVVITVDTDADGDGIADNVEGLTTDTDMDGTPDYQDTDSDGDGELDSAEGDGDADSDGLPDRLESNTYDGDGDTMPDYLDTDSDGDGTPDSAEGFGDSDSDGIPDRIESNIADPDSDTTPNYLDTDSDGDGKLDSAEGYLGDTDRDGIPNYLDDQDLILYYFPMIFKN